MDFPSDSVVKNPPANEGDTGDAQFNPWVGNNPWRRKEPTPVFVPGNAMDRGAWPATEHGGGKGVREDSATKTNNVYSVVIYIHVLLVLSGALTRPSQNPASITFTQKALSIES